MKEGFIKDTYELIIKEIQTTISILYIIIVGIGMLFTYQKYAEFGINIFDYADIFDFLIAPFSDFSILLFSVISIFIAFLFFKLDSFYQKRFPKLYSKMNFGWDNKNWFPIYRNSAFLFLFIFYLYISADYYGKYSKQKTLTQTTINIKYVDNKTATGILIGKTTDIIFLLENKKVKAIPINSFVKEFEIK